MADGSFFHEKTDEHSNESLNTHESTDMHMADTKFGYKLKRTRVLFLGAAITIPTTSFAQKNVVENVAKRDSVCRKGQKALSDTTALYLYLRFQGFSPLILKRKEQEKRFNPKALSWPKFDPDKEKFNNLQLINILGEHLLR